MILIWWLGYNVIIYPLMYFFVLIISLFNGKIRKAFIARHKQYKKIKDFNKIPGRRSILIHAASMGEFEHIKPVIGKIKETFPHSSIVVTFFSPSGYNNVKSFKGVDYFLYSPFDFPWILRRFYQKIKPDVYIIAKYDIWPNAVWEAYKLQIPVFIVNASLGKHSKRLKGLSYYFTKEVYKNLTEIWVSSFDDTERFRKLASNADITVTGDTKFDQVLWRKENVNRNRIIDEMIVKNKKVFIAGSIWPEDWDIIIPVFNRMVEKLKDLIVILVPHEPTEHHLNEIEQKLEHKYIRYSRVNSYENEHFIIVNRIGVLASLYSRANFAYVGGSFRQNVHNVMEPAVFGIPVFYGPVHKNSFEAIELNSIGASIVIQNEDDFEENLKKVLVSDEARMEYSEKATLYVHKNSGASDRIVQKLKSYLS